MKVIVELESAQAARLQQEADRLGISPSELAKAAVVDLLSVHDPAFSAAARAAKKYGGALRELAK